jgi:hypothetical protein
MGKLIALAIVAVLVGVPHPARPADAITARARLKEATAEARKWKADAALSGVATSGAGRDGTSVHWTYSFQSKSTRSCLRVVALATGAVRPTDLGECTLGTAVGDGFVDSPAAVSGALAGGFQAGETIDLVLVHLDDSALAQPRECWKVASPDRDFDPAKAVMRGWCVDPKTGKLVTRTAGERRKR